jgi:hypothetical protein
VLTILVMPVLRKILAAIIEAYFSFGVKKMDVIVLLLAST